MKYALNTAVWTFQLKATTLLLLTALRCQISQVIVSSYFPVLELKWRSMTTCTEHVEDVFC